VTSVPKHIRTRFALKSASSVTGLKGKRTVRAWCTLPGGPSALTWVTSPLSRWQDPEVKFRTLVHTQRLRVPHKGIRLPWDPYQHTYTTTKRKNESHRLTAVRVVSQRQPQPAGQSAMRFRKLQSWNVSELEKRVRKSLYSKTSTMVSRKGALLTNGRRGS
jgi:hypothetical protein